MSMAASPTEFKGAFSKQLTELRELIDWLWQEHGVSYVKAGDDKVYAFGGEQHIVVMDESRWDGLIEFITPKGGITIKPTEGGNFDVSGGDLDEKSIKEMFKEGIDFIKQYYESRYWKTPQAAS
ncbi:MAG: hypothetical protein HY231_10070 [Acidobacteria bacterium]|nr:hypothetical protein [Acidobacteriota bacterium]